MGGVWHTLIWGSTAVVYAHFCGDRAHLCQIGQQLALCVELLALELLHAEIGDIAATPSGFRTHLIQDTCYLVAAM